jgi:hypothetical protein
MIDILDILIKIATSIEDDYMGDVWFKLMRIDDGFARYARSNEGRQVFLDYATEIVVNGPWVCYYLFRRRHRNHINDLPAVINFENMINSWYYYDDKIHRNNDKPAVISPGGNMEWFVHGKRHRENNMPAKILRNGRYKEWWYNGVFICLEES